MKIIAVILVAILAFFGISIKGCSFIPGGGDGDGSGSGSRSFTSISASASDISASSQEDQVVEIRIEKNDIYFDGELCESVDDLQQKIIDYGTTREYVFVYEKAIKATYDEVNKVLSELESALEITINDK